MKKDYEFAAEFCDDMRKALGDAVAAIKSDLLAGVRAAKSPQALSQALRDLSTRNGDVITWNMTVGGEQVYTMEAVAGYIYAEMINNCDSEDVKHIMDSNKLSTSWLLPLAKIVAYIAWTTNVASDIKWDH